LHGERTAKERAQEQMQQLDQARRERQLVDRLDTIHLNRVGVVKGRFDAHPNAERADREYEAAFREADLGRIGEDPAAVAARIEASTIRGELVAALDDWAVCAHRADADAGRQSWLLEVLRRADPNPAQIRQRLRDPALWNNRAALTKLAETALAERTSAQLPVALAERLLYAGADAVPFLLQVQREYPGDFWANYALGMALLTKNPGESMRYLQAALAIRPRTAVLYDNLGVTLLEIGRSDEAIEHLQQALRIDPEYANSHNNLGSALQVKGRLDEAIAHFRHALRTDPLVAEVQCNLGGALVAKGRHDEGLEHLQQALRSAPRMPEAHAHLSTGLKARGGPQAVIAHYRQMLRTDPEFALAHAYLGGALVEAGQADEAEGHLREALRLDSKLTTARHQLGLVLSSRGQYDEALEHFQQLITLNPRLPTAHGALGQVLIGLGRFRDARDATRRGLDLLPPDDPQRANFARELKRCEDLLTLEARLPAVLRGEDRPAGAAEHFRFAEVCRAKRRYADGARLFEKAFADKPLLPDHLNATFRYNAARAAALAGGGQSEDGDKLSLEERAHWRLQARAWLQAALAVWARKLDGGTALDRAQVKTIMRRWQAEPDLAGLREPGALAKLPAEERDEWLVLWTEVGALLKRATSP
jgi:serine/threonine-protein kinase